MRPQPRYVDEHTRDLTVPAGRAWEVLSAAGGDVRRYPPARLWKVRGLLDRMVGGPGFRLQRPDGPVHAGDTVDFWEVEETGPASMRLRALTRLPGIARLELRIEPRDIGSRLVLRSTFEPGGAAGHAYWWGQLAAHKVVFAMMADRLARLAAED